MEQKEIYQRPEAELIRLHSELNLLVHFSADGSFEDIEDGGELLD